MDEYRILGIDPGLNTTGYGVIRVDDRELSLVEAGVIRGGDSTRPLGQRLVALQTGLQDVFAALSPAAVAMEELYSHYERPQTAVLMGHARGVLCLAAAQHGHDVHHYAATKIKRAVTGNGRAPKSQVQQVIARLLGLEAIPEPADVADALAIAACHYFLNVRKTVTPAGGAPHTGQQQRRITT